MSAIGIDFGALPPELNSSRMYSGAGSASMVTAAAAWDALTAELESAASGYFATVANLTGNGWTGPASAAMAKAAAPFAAWMHAVAAQTKLVAAQARAAAEAYEAAHAVTVPPAQVAANRSLVRTLIAHNTFGQNTAAIAAGEAQYGQMWAQDAAAMYGYASASAAAAQMNPFAPPRQNTDPAGLARQSASTAQAASTPATDYATQLVAAIPQALQSFAQAPGSALSDPGMSTILSSGASGLTTALAYIPSTLLPNMIGYFAGTGENAAGGLGGPFGGLGALLNPEGPLGDLGALGGSMTGATTATTVGWHQMMPSAAAPVGAAMGKAVPVGGLSVPQTWAAAAPPMNATGPALTSAVAPTTQVIGPDGRVATVPAGLGMSGMGGHAPFGHTPAPRFGLKPTPPTVVRHTPAAG
ncbi:PPE family protein [Mycobacterium sp. 1274756.6]|uniref:PPE family protein n=1 Tax=Mycobacterium sp. 1274756.6 TaxID=1834076 RepID=UPI0007FDC8F9|nr:PPE family protein [Mycobacterium sp. 1274756.6]OBJ67918.1 hypothetical protein A5643_15630 [Mycobacterium sp. 1274756.6]